MYYFAYGSNMSEKRLTRRIPARKLGIAALRGYGLFFTKPSEADGSAKCDICPADSVVYGVLYEIDPEDKPVLDRFEGLGYGYRTEAVEVEFRGEPVEALTYIAVNMDDSLKPFSWYRQHVINGAVENGLPSDYIEGIRRVPVMEDPNSDRATEELAIYERLLEAP